jgi:sterol desaturase/sphingolipid hydroxylase (fatty acid hydroxylase superfamily)
LTLVAFTAFGLAGLGKLAVAAWTTHAQSGLLNALGLSWPARVALSLLLIDLVDYALHRAQHAVPFIWRFHRVHHADPHLDATSSLRFHPLDAVLQNGYQALLLPVLGINFDAMVAFDTLLLGVLYVQHANVRWPAGIDRVLRAVFATPDVHRVHHAADPRYTNSNYGDLFSVWDRLFGTYRMTDPATLRYGLDEFALDRDQTVRAMLMMPLAPVHDEAEASAVGTPAAR